MIPIPGRPPPPLLDIEVVYPINVGDSHAFNKAATPIKRWRSVLNARELDFRAQLPHREALFRAALRRIREPDLRLRTRGPHRGPGFLRSEEHTSELQS